MDACCRGGFLECLDDAHMVRTLGELDLPYLLHLGLLDDDLEPAMLWASSFRAVYKRGETFESGHWSKKKPFDPAQVFPINRSAVSNPRSFLAAPA